MAGSRRLAHLRRASGAQAVEVEPRVVDREATVGREPFGDWRDVGLLDLLHPPASVAGEVVVMLGTACHVAVYVAVLLETARHSGDDERLERAKHRRATNPGIASPKAVVEILRRHAATHGGQRIGDQQALPRDALAGSGQPIGGGGGIERGGGHRQRLARIDRTDFMSRYCVSP